MERQRPRRLRKGRIPLICCETSPEAIDSKAIALAPGFFVALGAAAAARHDAALDPSARVGGDVLGARREVASSTRV